MKVKLLRKLRKKANNAFIVLQVPIGKNKYIYHVVNNVDKNISTILMIYNNKNAAIIYCNKCRNSLIEKSLGIIRTKKYSKIIY